MIARRQFITLVGGMATAWPLGARAQQIGKFARIGVFGAPANNLVMGPATRAFIEELRRLGYREGENLTVEFRPVDQELPALYAQAEEMVRLKVDVLVALGAEVILKAMMTASKSIPIVFVANSYDPIALGYVKSLSRPGGNATGIFLRQTELAEKQVELLTQAFLDSKRLAVLWDAITADQFAAAERRAKLLGLQVHSFRLKNPPYDFDAAFQAITEVNPQMLLVLSSAYFGPYVNRIVELELRHRLPAMHVFKGRAGLKNLHRTISGVSA